MLNHSNQYIGNLIDLFLRTFFFDPKFETIHLDGQTKRKLKSKKWENSGFEKLVWLFFQKQDFFCCRLFLKANKLQDQQRNKKLYLSQIITIHNYSFDFS